MNARHTSGPWRECGHDRDGCPCGQVWSVAADMPVANCDMRNEEGVPSPSLEETKANARLIAAAPDLLEALSHLLRFVPDDVTAEWIEARNLGRAAIAKALGEDAQ